MISNCHHKICIIGCGMVGTCFAYSAINKGLANEYILIDEYPDFAEGMKWDLEDAIAFSPLSNAKIKVGKYEDCVNAQIIVITAGKNENSINAESRLQLLNENAKIISDIANKIVNTGFNGVIIMVSNPCDILATVFYNAAKTLLKPQQVISSGTNLDSARLRIEVANDHKHVNSKYVSAWLFGEHGNSAALCYTPSAIHAYMPQFKDKEWFTYKKNAIDKAYKIIKAKKSTFYGIGASLAQIAQQILNNTHEILPIGVYDSEYHIHLSQLAVLGNKGVVYSFLPEMTKEMHLAYAKSGEILRTNYLNLLKLMKEQ